MPFYKKKLWKVQQIPVQLMHMPLNKKKRGKEVTFQLVTLLFQTLLKYKTYYKVLPS